MSVDRHFMDAPLKRPRTVLTLDTKLSIIQRLENGETAASLGRLYHINESSVRTIKKNAERIRNSVAQSCSLTAKKTVRVRNPLLEKIEKMLAIWVEDQNKKKMVVNSRIIRMKALKLYEHLQEKHMGSSSAEPFAASKGWFDKFQKRQNLQNIKMKGDAGSGEDVAPYDFADEFKAVVRAKGYKPQQVFNLDETSLFWKRMPSSTFLSKEEKTAPGFKAAKDRLTVLLCGNAKGDFKCKPLLVYHSQTPRALKGVRFQNLPVHWRSNRKAWVTGKLFEDWFLNCFCVEVEQYCCKSGIAFKALLVLDNAPGHPAHLNDLHPNIRVMFLPPSSTSLMQPMNQGVLTIFKIYYMKLIFLQLLKASEGCGKQSVRDFWRSYNILHAIKNIRNAWNEVKDTLMNVVWKKLWKECVQDFRESVNPFSEASEIVGIGQKVPGEGFEDLTEADIIDLLQSHEEELSVEDLVELTQKEQEDQDVSMQEDKLTVKRLARFFTLANQLAQEAVDMDPDIERSLQFGRNLTSALATYREIYREKQHQSNSLH
ncbi:tigger transposable element-derived protein 1 isoform X2 [Cryptotermes secundus]|nr:tigger transposable element-derived protein 1 isoform X2 [Cryptotermes secundus]